MSLKTLLILLSLNFAIYQVTSYSIVLEAQETYCLWKDYHDRTIGVFSFIISGRNERNVEIKISDDRGKELQTIQESSDYLFDFVNDYAREVSFCFKNLDGNQKVVTFDFSEDEKLSNVVTKENIDEVLNELKMTQKNFRTIIRNQHFQQVREDVHRHVAMSTESRVLWCSITKMIILVVLIFAQVYILKSFFHKEKGFVNV